jgi:hypothetical protein
MILLEISPPFQFKPSLRTESMAGGWRFMWGWLAVAWVPYGFSEYVEGIAQSAIKLYRKGELRYRP